MGCMVGEFLVFVAVSSFLLGDTCRRNSRNEDNRLSVRFSTIRESISSTNNDARQQKSILVDSEQHGYGTLDHNKEQKVHDDC